MKNNEFKVGDRVKSASKKDAFDIACGFATPKKITTKTEFEVAVIVENGITDDMGTKQSGLIIIPLYEDRNEFFWPYVWNFKKFVKI
jgi:hypothetical protein